MNAALGGADADGTFIYARFLGLPVLLLPYLGVIQHGILQNDRSSITNGSLCRAGVVVDMTVNIYCKHLPRSVIGLLLLLQVLGER